MLRVSIALLWLLFAASTSWAADRERLVMVDTALQENGQPVSLELVLFAPDGPGPFPLVLFNHGSTGSGDRPELFARTYSARKAAEFFNQLGYIVVFPQRRGRGRSQGLYDEGFLPDRSRYSCDPSAAAPAIERALDDVDAALKAARNLPDVGHGPVLLAGHSRGGLLALLQAARDPHDIAGVINFSGGWLGSACPDYVFANRDLFTKASAWRGPTLFLYAERDPFYPIKASRANFAAFLRAGGQGRFERFELEKGVNGHNLVDFPEAWSPTLATFLQRIQH